MDVQLSDAFTHTGDLDAGITSVADECMSGDSVLVAAITFAFDTEDPTVFQLEAAAWSATDCDGIARFYIDLFVLVFVDDDAPVASQTWGAVKTLFR